MPDNTSDIRAQNNGDNGENQRSKRGFAAMDRDRQREIAAKGGRTAHEKGVAHEFTSREAADAGRIGGQSRSKNQNGGSQGRNNQGDGNELGRGAETE